MLAKKRVKEKKRKRFPNGRESRKKVLGEKLVGGDRDAQPEIASTSDAGG